jgi:hypothetical protein
MEETKPQIRDSAMREFVVHERLRNDPVNPAPRFERASATMPMRPTLAAAVDQLYATAGKAFTNGFCGDGERGSTPTLEPQNTQIRFVFIKNPYTLLR